MQEFQTQWSKDILAEKQESDKRLKHLIQYFEDLQMQQFGQQTKKDKELQKDQIWIQKFDE